MTSYRDHLIAVAAELDLDAEALIAQFLQTHIAPDLPDRYQHLVADVLWRLPEGWDDAMEWDIGVSADQHPQGYASTNREEEAEGEIDQLWRMTLYPSLLYRLSDTACRWVIAHEFGHIASGLATGSMIGGVPYTRDKETRDQYVLAEPTSTLEDVASMIALDWGFSPELQAWLKEEDGF